MRIDVSMDTHVHIYICIYVFVSTYVCTEREFAPILIVEPSCGVCAQFRDAYRRSEALGLKSERLRSQKYIQKNISQAQTGSARFDVVGFALQSQPMSSPCQVRVVTSGRAAGSPCAWIKVCRILVERTW